MTQIKVSALRLICDPFCRSPWGHDGGPITFDEIDAAIASERFVRSPVNYNENRETHINRIAYLAVVGWDDAIDVDVGVPSLGCYVEWPVDDGNHRFAAAIYLDSEFIEAGLSGCCDLISELFGDQAVDPAVRRKSACQNAWKS